MRDFLIGALDKLIAVVVVLMALVVVIGAIAMMAGMGGMPGTPMAGGGGGFISGLIFLVVGLIYVVFVGGFMYLGLGIYHNTKRTADALANR